MVAAAAITSIAANRQAGHPGFGRIFLRTLSWAWPWILAQLLVGILIVSILIYIQENSAANLIESVLKNGELGLLEQTIQRALPK
jgi:F0F1-type ATP synthase membrane subunit c/vacuolar-type H+-ATPase subunit K